MHLIEIFLPCADNDGRPFAKQKFAAVRERLTKEFGGVTAFTRAPAHGVFKDGEAVMHDDIVVLEVMVDRLDRNIWARYRKELEQDFAQDEILIRATAVEKL